MANSSPQRRAVIDVGTNSVKLLVADVTGSDVTPVDEQSKQTRLGRGFYETHLLQADSIFATAEAIKKFSEQAKILDAKKNPRHRHQRRARRPKCFRFAERN
jgi:exopolyphosphatase/guanosine-5'-triphosphate,3'-diphosphate pyrophosphatase